MFDWYIYLITNLPNLEKTDFEEMETHSNQTQNSSKWPHSSWQKWWGFHFKIMIMSLVLGNKAESYKLLWQYKQICLVSRVSQMRISAKPTKLLLFGAEDSPGLPNLQNLLLLELGSQMQILSVSGLPFSELVPPKHIPNWKVCNSSFPSTNLYFYHVQSCVES